MVGLGPGFGSGATSPDGLLIPVTGTVAQMEHAFAVPLVETRLRSGRVAREGTADPEVPASLAGAIGGVIGLSTVAESHPQSARSEPRRQRQRPGLHRRPVPLVGTAPCRSVSLCGGVGVDRWWRMDRRSAGVDLRPQHALRPRPAGSRPTGGHLRAGALHAR